MATNWTERRVVVTGLGVVTPLGHQLDTFWQNLITGQCGVDQITSFDMSAFDTRIAAEVKIFDPAPAFPSPKDIRQADRYSQSAFMPGIRHCSIPATTSTRKPARRSSPGVSKNWRQTRTKAGDRRARQSRR